MLNLLYCCLVVWRNPMVKLACIICERFHSVNRGRMIDPNQRDLWEWVCKSKGLVGNPEMARFFAALLDAAMIAEKGGCFESFDFGSNVQSVA